MEEVVPRAFMKQHHQKGGREPAFQPVRECLHFSRLIPSQFSGEEVTLLMLMQMIQRLRQRDEEGQALVEYALILGLIAVFAIGSLTLLGGNVDQVLGKIASAIGSVL
jgi:pilus assembly protein Flp/PilA